MLRKSFQGIDEQNADFKAGNLMSPREQAAHLCTCYMAAKDAAEGNKPTWETYDVADKSWPALSASFDQLRKSAVDAYTDDDEEKLKHANDYIASHDNYHVGQMCAIRLAMDPGWDPYCIYEP